MNNILISIWLQAWVDGMKHRSSCCPDRTFLDRNIQLFEILLRYVDNVIFSPEAKIIFFSSFKIHFCIRYSWIWMQIDDVSQSQAVRNRMTCLHRPWLDPSPRATVRPCSALRPRALLTSFRSSRRGAPTRRVKKSSLFSVPLLSHVSCYNSK